MKQIQRFSSAVLVTLALSLSSLPLVYSLPEGENVLSGSATFDRGTPSTLNISTSSDRLIVDYNGFSIAQNEAVHFNQPSSSSIALNRVVGQDPSSILGTLTANGRIFIVNPNGVIFGAGSHPSIDGDSLFVVLNAGFF